MVHATCSVRDCLSSSRKRGDIKFHSFPVADESKCQYWVQVCGRPDLDNRRYESLKNSYICSLHFEKRMYGKKVLKRTAIPTLLLPLTDTVHTQTNPIFKIMMEGSYQTASTSTDHAPRKRKMATQSTPASKRLKLSHGKNDITINQFLKACDKFLAPNLSAMVKAQINFKVQNEAKKYTKEFKIFCMNIYCSCPRAYRILSKTMPLPSRPALISTFLSMETNLTEDMWDVLKITAKQMSSIGRQCVLCMKKKSIKPSLMYNANEDKILGLHEIYGQQKLIIAEYAFTLMLRGIISNWKLPVGVSFISRGKLSKSLRTWIFDTVGRIQDTGFHVRAVVSDPEPEFLEFTKVLDVSKDFAYFDIDGEKVFYMFDVSKLMICIRNSFMDYNFEFDGKTAKWEDLVNAYEHDKTRIIRSASRLTDAHLQPNKFQKQIVRFALQVFSNSTVRALKEYQTSDEDVQIADGTIPFIETMNNLFDILNSSKVDSTKPFTRPYSGEGYQTKFLDRIQFLFRNMKFKTKNNNLDVTDGTEFIDAFNLTVNSLSQLFRLLKCSGCKYILTRRLINNDCFDNFFNLVNQISGKNREATCVEYVRVFQKNFVSQLLNMADATNRTDDFEKILARYLDFTKRSPKAVEIRKPREITKENFGNLYDIPEEHAFYHISASLLRSCVDKHKDQCQLIVNYASSSPFNAKRVRFGHLKAPPDDFLDYIHSLETELKSVFASIIGRNLARKLFQRLRTVEYNTKPCACFPTDFLIKLFIRMRIFYIIKFNNGNLNSFKSGGRKYLSLAHI